MRRAFSPASMTGVNPMNLLYPKIARRDLPVLLRWAALGGCIGGLYGVVHDQLTFSLGPEYFTLFKFRQFAWADLGLPPRVFAGTVGFFAAGSVGAGAGWFLARLAAPFAPSDTVRRRAILPLAIVAAGGAVGGLAGFLLGQSRRGNPDLSNWDFVLTSLDVADGPAFVHVAYVHNAGYLGAFIGFIAAAILIRRQRNAAETRSAPRNSRLEK